MKEVVSVKGLVPSDLDVWGEDSELIRISGNENLRRFRYAEVPTDEYG